MYLAFCTDRLTLAMGAVLNSVTGIIQKFTAIWTQRIAFTIMRFSAIDFNHFTDCLFFKLS
jgi:hypothetical protein